MFCSCHHCFFMLYLDMDIKNARTGKTARTTSLFLEPVVCKLTVTRESLYDTFFHSG